MVWKRKNRHDTFVTEGGAIQSFYREPLPAGGFPNQAGKIKSSPFPSCPYGHKSVSLSAESESRLRPDNPQAFEKA